MKPRIVILGSDIADLGYLYSVVRNSAEVVGIIVERPVARSKVFLRRVKRFGLLAAVGQVLFVLCLLPLIRLMSQARVRALRTTHQMDVTVPRDVVHHVASVNAPETISLIQSLAPSHVLVYGTRVIAARVLKTIGVPVINIHAGITPRYRGGHGAYWALAEKNAVFAGVTLHRVDAGIDTGEILAQAHVVPTKQDTIVTYPLLQLIAGATLAQQELAGKSTHKIFHDCGESERLYTHPALWEYLFNFVTTGTK